MLDLKCYWYRWTCHLWNDCADRLMAMEYTFDCGRKGCPIKEHDCTVKAFKKALKRSE